MFYVRYYFLHVFVFLLQMIVTTALMNLHFTDITDNMNTNEVLQHHCLYSAGQDGDYFGIDFGLSIPYCLSEPLSQFNLDKDNSFPRFTFDQLLQRNITSQQLYLWSAPMDLIEHYQDYLNQISTTNNSQQLSQTIFYNCTWSRFGSQCEFEFDADYRYKIISLSELLLFYNFKGIWHQIQSTCYMHLPCQRSNGMKCLDWMDICDGKIDCLNDGIDEKYCWQLESNVCEDIQSTFYDSLWASDHTLFYGGLFISSNCIHLYIEHKGSPMMFDYCTEENPIDTDCDEMVCRNIILTSSCSIDYSDLLENLYSIKENSTSNICWTAFQCLLQIPNTICYTDDQFELLSIINTTCEDITLIPSVPILLGDIYITYIKNRSYDINNENDLYFYLCSNNSLYRDYFDPVFIFKFSHMICYQSIRWSIDSSFEDLHKLFRYRYGPIHRYNPFVDYSSQTCRAESNQFYQCINSSKCISIHRLMDEIADCPFRDDENPKTIQQNNYANHYRCRYSGKYIPLIWTDNDICDCVTSQYSVCDDEWIHILVVMESTKFISICDGRRDFLSISADERNETDETNCQYWPCVTYFTQCNGKKNCIDGRDEESCEQDESQQKLALTHVTSEQSSIHCHRGVRVRVWSSNKSRLTCFCPPSYYGHRCQYQNQRINIYLGFETPFNTLHQIWKAMAYLIDNDNERIIHSYRLFTVAQTINCGFAYAFSLIYSTRPKNPTKSYSIHIDMYDRQSLNYRGSFLLPVRFPFLPVHRFIETLSIAPNKANIIECSSSKCNKRGRCLQYLNQNEDTTFCQCNRGWSGKFCQIQYHCTCSSDSICIGVSAHNRSVCVCPPDRLGPRCLISDPTCPLTGNAFCRNQGQCISFADSHLTSDNFICKCRIGFHGEFCEFADHKIELSFGNDIVKPFSMHIHFFTIEDKSATQKRTISKTVLTKQTLISLYWQYEFHLILTQFGRRNHYYFVAFHMDETKSINITKTIHSSDRCAHITELVNRTIVNFHFMRRIKYYHLICQTYSSNLSCFHDEELVCACNQYGNESHPYCFNSTEIDAKTCRRQNICLNGGQCSQEKWACSNMFWCTCPLCFYGKQCQFSVSRFGLTLDSILSYQIQPQIKLAKQLPPVIVTAVLSIVFIILGFINSLCSWLTFKNRSIHQVGCGIYLLISSIITMLLTVCFGFKVWFLIWIQISLIENQLFLKIQCHSIDFLVRCCLSLDQWLNACVATERAICAIQGVRFNKTKSKQFAKLIIILLILFNIGTSIHDSIYRQVIYENTDNDDDDDEGSSRAWCIINYPSSRLSTYNHIMLTFHFFVPFLLNIIALIILIGKKSRHQRTIHRDKNFRKLLREQFQQHKHLFLAPIVSILLSIPRLIIAYTTECMQTENDVWLYLFSYFISFIPPMLTFLVFVMPSKVFKKEFQKTVRKYRTNLQNLLRRSV